MGLDKHLAHNLFLIRADQNIANATNQIQKLDALQHGHANPYDNPGRSNRSQINYKTGNNQQYVPWSLMQLNQAHQEPATDVGRQDISKGIVEANTYGRAIPSREEEGVNQEYFTILEESELLTLQTKIKNKSIPETEKENVTEYSTKTRRNESHHYG